MRATSRRTRLVLAAGVGGMLSLAAGAAWVVDSFRHQIFVQKLESPDHSSWLALYIDNAGFGDWSWHVYRLPLALDPANAKMRSGFSRGALFETYEEGPDPLEGERIDVHADRWLVLTRGGIYHALYDLREERIVINEQSPWHAFWESDLAKSLPQNATPEQMEPLVLQWKREHLHEPIARIIEER